MSGSDQAAASIFEHGRRHWSHRNGRLSKHQPCSLKSLIFGSVFRCEWGRCGQYWARRQDPCRWLRRQLRINLGGCSCPAALPIPDWVARHDAREHRRHQGEEGLKAEQRIKILASCSALKHGSPVQRKRWLGGRDSKPDKQIQSL